MSNIHTNMKCRYKLLCRQVPNSSDVNWFLFIITIWLLLIYINFSASLNALFIALFVALLWQPLLSATCLEDNHTNAVPQAVKWTHFQHIWRDRDQQSSQQCIQPSREQPAQPALQEAAQRSQLSRNQPSADSPPRAFPEQPSIQGPAPV